MSAIWFFCVVVGVMAFFALFFFLDRMAEKKKADFLKECASIREGIRKVSQELINIKEAVRKEDLARRGLLCSCGNEYERKQFGEDSYFVCPKCGYEKFKMRRKGIC